MRDHERATLLEGCGELLVAQCRDHLKVIGRNKQFSGELARGNGDAPVAARRCPECGLLDGAHEEGCPELEGSARDYSDPTGELAARPDAFLRVNREYDRELEKAHDHLERAERIRLSTLSSVKNEDEATPCQSCARLTNKATGSPYFEPARPGRSLCRWCGDYRDSEGSNVWPPVSILEMHHRRQTVSAQAKERAERLERQAKVSACG